MKIIKSVSSDDILVDDEDYDWLFKYKWYSSNGYGQRCNDKGKSPYLIRMHREILEHHGNNLDNMEVDHKDANGLNNQKCNLRAATHSQNLSNKNKPIHNTSGYKGVSWRKKDKFFEAYITVNQKRIRLGCYDDAISAAEAYDKAALKYHGEFAKLNFPNNVNLEVKPRKVIIHKNNTSGYRGVSHKGRKWLAEFQRGKTKVRIGTFDTPVEAARAYNQVAIQYLGSEAKLNNV